MATYRTKQQSAILDCMQSQGDRCISAVALAEALHAKGVRVGVATVYRQMEKLEGQGRIHKVVTEEGAFYQYCPHEDDDCFLLKCEQCGRIEHVDCERLAPLYRHLADEHHFRINPRRTMLYGTCESCRGAKP